MSTLLKKVTIPALALLLSSMAFADQPGGTYQFDKKGAHQFVTFKISHLGYSWLYGRFNDFNGTFTVDAENPENSQVTATIQTASVDSNHAERDKHLRGDDFLDVDEYPTATFKSTSIEKTGEKTAKITGDFTLHGVTKPVTLDAKLIGYGDDPWGGYRMGLEASTTLTLADFGITKNLGPASETVEIIISVEGIKQ
ncbi:YceI family protein [Alcanivorax sp.]|jgi:polyisoprenoid-binding protein YceI|uniref:YceI family protein n=1 Tax=Alcanivorax sp. TaxID=1872427 RepID=UPI0025B97C83|nr:YceI family protein [Alcanivorax sp.]|tara:strand:+ start:207 stop:797 length:591 start_codon:yes stop_codon:yes gene_type:complete